MKEIGDGCLNYDLCDGDDGDDYRLRRARRFIFLPDCRSSTCFACPNLDTIALPWGVHAGNRPDEFTGFTKGQLRAGATNPVNCLAETGTLHPLALYRPGDVGARMRKASATDGWRSYRWTS